nr:immunoglobulin heavy chain junction region [Macaca mulatta]
CVRGMNTIMKDVW